MKTIAINKRARFDYNISDTYETGIILSGQEVKSSKLGHVSLKESFVTVREQELYLINTYISPYSHAGKIPSYDPSHSRKLLLKKSEIKHLIGKVRTEGLTLVPLRMYTKKRLIKLEIGIGRGKKKFDKRELIAKRDADRNMRRFLKDSQK